ncbi:MAG: aldo/keto reductase [Verrucomicrobiota bacterium]|jgi:aryl-alcohol dehydrogenase-like predicted oxidoreductase
MKYRELGRTGWKVSEISFGAWAIGGSWGNVEDKDSLGALHAALDGGVNFFDTADVYGDGHSERLLAKLKKERKEEFYIATKAGRRLPKQTPEGYNRENLTSFVERSLRNLETDAIDLLQLHCPPTEVYYMPEVFTILDNLVKTGKLRHYGVSVEKVEEAIKAVEFPGVQTVQIIFNIFRQRPGELLFARAQRNKVGILARVPLASGLLSGKITHGSKFAKDDHRNFNRHGEVFDRGETFSGVDFETGLRAVEELKLLAPDNATPAQLALRWILEFPAVSCAIPGAKRPAQVAENIAASDMKPLSAATMEKIRVIYDRQIRPLVHHYW